MGTTSEGFVTGLGLIADVPQVRKKLLSRHDMDKNWYTMLKEMGLGMPVEGPIYAHWEQDWIINNFLVGSVVTPSTGAGTSVVIALDSSSMYTTTVTGYGTQSFSYPAQWDIIKLVDGSEAQIILKDETVTPHRLTVRPRLTTNDIATKLVAGGRYWITTNAFAEGTLGADPKEPRLYRQQNNTQIIKSAYGITGSAMTDRMPVVSVSGSDGGNYMMIVGAESTQKLHMDRISKALFFGVQGDGNVTQSMTGAQNRVAPVRTTQGLDDYIVNGGGNLLTYSYGNFVMSDFDNIGTILQRERAGTKTFILPLAYPLRTQMDNTLKTYMNNTCFQYASESGKINSDMFNSFSDKNDFFLWLSFGGVHKGGYNYLLRTQQELNEQQGAGTEGYNWSGVGYVLPLDFVQSKFDKDATASVGYRHKSLNGYDREMEQHYTGGAGIDPATSSIDAKYLDIRSDIGAENALSNQMIKLVGI
jgi:hypothetical protein